MDINGNLSSEEIVEVKKGFEDIAVDYLKYLTSHSELIEAYVKNLSIDELIALTNKAKDDYGYRHQER